MIEDPYQRGLAAPEVEDEQDGFQPLAPLADAAVRPATALSMEEVRLRIHRKLLERLNLSNLDGLTRDEASEAIRPTGESGRPRSTSTSG
jgi:hypothetical protein